MQTETLQAANDASRIQMSAADVKRLLAFASEGLTAQASDVMRVPLANYGPDRWRRECDEVFRKVPLAVGYSFDLPSANSYRTLDILDVPILLTRDGDGVFHALINVCTHRGVCLAQEGSGSARRFKCPYHGWTFDVDGRLAGLPAEKKFGHVDRNEYGLLSLSAEERYGILWITLTPGDSFDLDDWLGPAVPFLKGLRLDTCYPFGQAVVEAGNWKAVMDGFLETYHFPTLHPDTRDYFASDLSAVDMLGRHALLTFASGKIYAAATQPVEEWSVLELASKNIFLFPNVGLGVNFPSEDLPGMQFASFAIYPGSAFDKSVTHVNIFTTEPAESPAEIAAVQARLDETVRVISDEDFPTVNLQMKGWASGALTHMTYGRNEMINQTWLHHGLVTALDEASFTAGGT